LAAKLGNLAVVHECLEKGANVNARLLVCGSS